MKINQPQSEQTRSKFLSYVLRHHPEKINLKLDKDGWADIESLCKLSDFTLSELETIVSNDEKTRYSIKDGKIRANQGHSTDKVNVIFKSAVPPVILYHGTNIECVSVILKQGLLPMSRHYVHLTSDLSTAKSVGGRRKSGFAILEIDAKTMYNDGCTFYLSENNVWLVKEVSPKYIKEIK